MLHRSFKPAKCKISLQMASARLKILRNKKEVQIQQLKRELAQLLEAGQDQTARIRVEHVVREEKTVAAYELIGIYCELLVARMAIVESQKKCPTDLKEAVASIVFASRRCSDVPELLDVLKHFTAKYGKEFVSAAVEVRPDCGVSRLLVEKLSVKAPDGPTKIKILSAIAEEHNIKWEPKSFGESDSKHSEDLLKGPITFEASSELHGYSPRFQNTEPSNVQAPPVVNVPHRPTENFNPPGSSYGQPGRSPSRPPSTVHSGTSEDKSSVPFIPPNARFSGPGTEERDYTHQYNDDGGVSPTSRHGWNMEFKDATAAARAAAEAAERASMAARAAAELSSKERITRHDSTGSQSSSPHSFKKEPAERDGGSKLQSQQHAVEQSSSSPPGRNSGMHYDDMGKSQEGLRDGDGERRTVKTSWEEPPRSRNEDPSEAYYQKTGGYSRKNSSELRQNDSFGKSGAKEQSSNPTHRYGSPEFQSEHHAEGQSNSPRGSNSRMHYEDTGSSGYYNPPSVDALREGEQKNIKSSWTETSEAKNEELSDAQQQLAGRYSRGNSSVTQHSDSFKISGLNEGSSEFDIITGYSEDLGLRKQSSKASSPSHSSTFSDEQGIVSESKYHSSQNDFEENVFATSNIERLPSIPKEENKYHTSQHDLEENVFAASNTERLQSIPKEEEFDDDYGRFFDKPKFDTEDAHDVLEYSFGSGPLLQESTALPFTDIKPWSFAETKESYGIHSSQTHLFTETQSSPVFDDGEIAVPLDANHLPTPKYDDYIPDSESKEKAKMTDFAAGGSSSRSPVMPMTQEVEEDFFPSEPDEPLEDSSKSERSGPESPTGLKFETLTGGLKNKGKILPPYTKSSIIKTTVKQDDESLISSGTSHKGLWDEKPNTEAKGKPSSSPLDPSSSDDEFEEEPPKRFSTKHQQHCETKKRSKAKAPIRYLHSQSSDEDEEGSISTSNISARPIIGFSRRTKPGGKIPDRVPSSKTVVSQELSKDDTRTNSKPSSEPTMPSSEEFSVSLSKPQTRPTKPLAEEYSASLAKPKTRPLKPSTEEFSGSLEKPQTRPTKPLAEEYSVSLAKPQTRPTKSSAEEFSVPLAKPQTRPTKPSDGEFSGSLAKPQTRPTKPSAEEYSVSLTKPQTRPTKPSVEEYSVPLAKPQARPKKPSAEEFSVPLAKPQTPARLPEVATSDSPQSSKAPSVESPSVDKPSHVHPKLPDSDDFFAKFMSRRPNPR